MFCVYCGAKLPDNAKFCYSCGKAVAAEEKPPAPQPNPPMPPAPPVPPPMPPRPQPKPRPKWLIPLIVGASVMAALVVVIGIGTATRRIMRRQPAPIESMPVLIESSAPSEPPETAGFLHYENGNVKFALDYPDGLSLSEPHGNNVLLSSGDAFRVAAEYAFQTTQNCFIYSAEDFARQIEADTSVLAGWIGSEEITSINIEPPARVSGNSLPCHLFNWDMALNGKDYTGGLYIFDSKGAFGCYTFMWMVERGAEKEEIYIRQAMKMLESFEITGPYQAEGYSILEAPGLGLHFAVQDAMIQGRMDIENDHVLIVPVGSTFSHSSIRIEKNTTYSPAADPIERALEGCSGYYLHKDGGQYLSKPTGLEVGRYGFTEVELEYMEDGLRHVASVILFPYEEDYWRITMLASEENLEATASVLRDVLISLSLGDGAVTSSSWEEPALSQADNNKIINEILTKVEGTEGFVQPDDFYQPLASFTDIDGNGVYELLVVYKVMEDGLYNVYYDVYAVSGGSYTPAATQRLLYPEVGGNSGTVGLAVDNAKKPYVKVETSTPQGDRFTDSVLYIPWNSGQTALDDAWVYMESRGSYGDEAGIQYILGDTKVDKADFEARQADFTNLWTDLNLNFGPGNGGNNMSFRQIREMDMNEYTFQSVG